LRRTKPTGFVKRRIKSLRADLFAWMNIEYTSYIALNIFSILIIFSPSLVCFLLFIIFMGQASYTVLLAIQWTHSNYAMFAVWNY
jgi:hypothetical protein